ncbi:VOC family protein [Kitasatospora sp. NBC_00315]|uniref:VOC family protein n=1 Tax=Kitasatospora sp. NBC_00315 TaxID=2975963 RepID=UPI00325169B9
MIGGITHVTMEAAELEHGVTLGTDLGFTLDFVDRVELPAAFEGIGTSDHTLPLALLAGPRGIRLEVVQHRRSTGRRGAYTPLFEGPPPHPGRPTVDRPGIRAALLRAGALADPACRAVAGPGGDAWFDSSGAPGGLAGLLCHAEDVRVEAAFWSAFARARWSTVGDEGAWGSVSSPLLPAPCRLVILPAEGDRPRHAMNDCGFPSIGVAATAIDADCARALAAGATLRAEPIVTTVGGRPLRMALIETPGGAPVELLSVHRDGSRGRPAARRAPVAPAASGAHPHPTTTAGAGPDDIHA